jgi:hypothetical protein
MPALEVVVMVPPAGPIDALVTFAGSSAAVGFGTAIVNDALPVFPSAFAEMTTLPAASAVALPALDTVATPAFDVDQATTTPGIDAPCWSRGVAVRVSVSPTSSALVEGETSTVVTTRRGTTGVVTPLSPPQDTDSIRSTAASVAALRKVFVSTILLPLPAVRRPVVPSA